MNRASKIQTAYDVHMIDMVKHHFRDTDLWSLNGKTGRDFPPTFQSFMECFKQKSLTFPPAPRRMLEFVTHWKENVDFNMIQLFGAIIAGSNNDHDDWLTLDLSHI